MNDHTRINVALNGRHFFATDVLNGNDAAIVINSLQVRFPASEGFKISATRWEIRGKEISI